MHTDTTVKSLQGPHPLNTIEMLIGQGTVFQNLLEQVRLVAVADCRVLLVGEEGSGKETLARAIHSCSDRYRLPFHKINCKDFHPNISQHPLQMLSGVGGESSPYTSDQQNETIGLTHGGTLYLHEVEALSPEAQTWLLRCLLTIEMESLNNRGYGREDEIRIIAGTTRNLQDDVAALRFRAELFYRLNVVPLQLLPLRQRLEDIEALTHHFVRMYAGKYGKTIDEISEKTFQVFRTYHWPRNIEELEGLVERSVILSNGPTLHLEHIVRGPSNVPQHS